MTSSSSHSDDASDASVTVSALALSPGGAGISTYIRELLRHLPQYLDASISAIVPKDSIVELPPTVQPISRPNASGMRRKLQALRPARETSLIHGLDVDLPLGSGTPLVTTVHDLAVFDTPWAFALRRVIGERLVVARSIGAADAVIAVSDFTADRVKALFQKDAIVIPEAPSPAMRIPTHDEMVAVRKFYDLPQRFVLHVGTNEPRKNILNLARACKSINIPLVVAGGSGWKTSTPMRVLNLGFVPQRFLPALYGTATIAAYVSVYEGFGLPPLDAMACGCPVLSTRVPSVQLLGGAALIVDSPTVENLSHLLGELNSDDARRMELGRTGNTLVQKLTWDSAARKTALVYEQFGIPLKRGLFPSAPAINEVGVQLSQRPLSAHAKRSSLLRRGSLWTTKSYVAKPKAYKTICHSA